MAQVDAFSKEVLGNQYEKRIVVVDELVLSPLLYFPAGTIVYDRQTREFYKVNSDSTYERSPVPEVVNVFYDGTWPAARPVAKSVHSIGGVFPPTWLTADDLWFEEIG